MAAPTYLTPQYITYAMIESQLLKIIDVQDVADPTTSGMYIGDVNTYMAEGEAYVIKNILSNYVKVPLETLDGGTFDDLYDNLLWRETYIAIRSLFVTAAYYYIYLNYFTEGGTNNGAEIVDQTAKQLNFYTNKLLRLDQAGNPSVKNAFAGLKPALNGSKLLPGPAATPTGIPLGIDQSYAAFNAIPNLRYGFNR